MSGSIEERGDPTATGRPGISRTKGAAALVLGALALIGVAFWQGTGTQEEKAAPEIYTRVPSADFAPTLRPLPVVAAVPQPPPLPPPQMPAAAPQAAAAAKAPRMMSYAVTAPPAPAAAVPAAAAPGAGGTSAAPEGGRAATNVAFRGQQIAGGRAGAAIDMSLTMMPGIYSCILDTAVSSERAGPFQCHTDEDILSPHGARLMDAGTTIIGSYQSDVRQGQSRIASLVATAWTPQGVPVPLGAQVSDELGRVGMSGQVNRHLVERFGGAVMLLLGQGAIDLARSALTQGNGNATFNLNTGGVSNLASEALRSTINIPNTVEKNQGERIAFFVTTPVSFADAYRLKPR